MLPLQIDIAKLYQTTFVLIMCTRLNVGVKMTIFCITSPKVGVKDVAFF